jgi:hypothetical protein
MTSRQLLDWLQKQEEHMPSRSKKQARTMAAAAHDPKFAKKVGIPSKVAKDFNREDTGTKKLSQAMKGSKKRSSKKAAKKRR